MNCLHCGDCCKRMSPLGSPCKHLFEIDSFVFCRIYANRPEECSNHRFPARHCPIGCSVLDINDTDEIQIRCFAGYEILRHAPQDTSEAVENIA
jgi:hypothetical protein